MSLIQNITEQVFEAPETSVKLVELGNQMREITNQITQVIENINGKSKAFVQAMQVSINKRAEEYLSQLEEKIPDITEDDLKKLSEYAEKAPDVEIPGMLTDFLSDTIPGFIEATGGSLIKLGSSGVLFGPESSFIMAGSSSSLAKSVQIMERGSKAIKFGKGLGWAVSAAAFCYGIYDDMIKDKKLSEKLFRIMYLQQEQAWELLRCIQLLRWRLEHMLVGQY